MKIFQTAICAILLNGTIASGADIFYVDNSIGNDSYSGKSEKIAADGKNGPFSSIGQAFKAATESCRIEIKNTGIPYKGGNALTKTGGTKENPLVIEGNGAEISGLGIIQPEKLQKEAENIYSTEFYPMSNMLKGYTKIQHWIDSPEIWFMDGQKAPNCKSFDELKQKPGAFFWDKANKKVLIHFPEGKNPSNTKIEIPVYNTSICINTDYVELSNMKSRYSWNDGFDTHGKGRNIKYRNCVASDNCGQAFSVHDTTSVVYENCMGFRNASTGITNVNKSYSLFRNCVISDNTFESGILGLEDSTTVFESCVITGNKPFEQIWQYKNSVLIFVNCYISPEDKNRGILNLERGRAIFDRCTFTNALFLASTNAKSSGELIIMNSIIKDVRKIVYLHKEFPGKIVMKNNIISKGSVIEKSGEQFSPDKWNGLITESENNLETDKIIQNSVYSSAGIKTNSDIDFQLEDAMKELIPAESLLNRKAEGKAGADTKELAEKYEVLKNKELNK